MSFNKAVSCKEEADHLLRIYQVEMNDNERQTANAAINDMRYRFPERTIEVVPIEPSTIKGQFSVADVAMALQTDILYNRDRKDQVMPLILCGNDMSSRVGERNFTNNALNAIEVATDARAAVIYLDKPGDKAFGLTKNKVTNDITGPNKGFKVEDFYPNVLASVARNDARALREMIEAAYHVNMACLRWQPPATRNASVYPYEALEPDPPLAAQ